MKSKIYFLESRPQFLILSVVLIFLSTAMGWYDGYTNVAYTFLALIGLLLLHTSTNVLNDYCDYKSGIDLNTERTPFSGGSGFIPSGNISAREALYIGIVSFALAIPIGVFFVYIKGWEIIPLFIIGAVFVLLYTSYITKIGMGISEISAGLGLGTLPVLGVYIILNEGITPSILYASIPSGILVFNLLFLNEFPDSEADKKGGRKTIPIILGKDKSAVLYMLLNILIYLWIICGVIFNIMPAFTLIALLTVPLALKAVSGAFAHSVKEKMIQAQGANVAVVLLTQILIGAGYILSKVII